MLTMEIDAVYSRLYNVAMFIESKIKFKKKKCTASLFFFFLFHLNLLDEDGHRYFGVDG